MPDKLLPWILLFTAILFEVAGITSMKLSRGFSEPLPSIARCSTCSRRSP
jgi:multidrug transporter EmrE-like cation transporter